MGQKGPEWSHQTNHRQRYSEFSAGSHRKQRFYDIHNVSRRSKSKFREQVFFQRLSFFCVFQKTLGIKLPFLVMIIKNLKKYFTFEVQVNITPEKLAHIFSDTKIDKH